MVVFVTLPLNPQQRLPVIPTPIMEPSKLLSLLMLKTKDMLLMMIRMQLNFTTLIDGLQFGHGAVLVLLWKVNSSLSHQE
jgi:hypothetical protein